MKRKIIERPPSARQKMINLMYIVLLAMLAMNISSDVLNGFSLVEESLSKSTANATLQNESVYSEFAASDAANHEKVGLWYEKALNVKEMSDYMFNLAEELKLLIAQEADGRHADLNNIKNIDDLEAATQVMLSPRKGRGQELYDAINNYREQILGMVNDGTKRSIISSNLSTSLPQKAGALGKNWQEYNFENTPVVAAITLLTKLQNDVRYAEGEVLHTLQNNIDVGDLRVNKLDAYVIPSSRNVVQGTPFEARIIMAAVDSTARPNIFIDGEQHDLEDGWYRVNTPKTGDFSINGYMEMASADGGTIRREFSQNYTVVSPSATVAATMMNVLYAGYDNPVSISVPGVDSRLITAVVKNGNGTLRTAGNGSYIANPSKVGQDFVISVLAIQDRSRQSMGDYTFHVRQLPDPTPFIEYTDDNGVVQRYRGGGNPLPKKYLMSADGIVAAIDNGLLNIGFRVLGFETTFFDNMGNAVSELSDGTRFSDRQKSTFQRLTRGKRFYIQRVRAIGPDGIERQLSTSLEVILN